MLRILQNVIYAIQRHAKTEGTAQTQQMASSAAVRMITLGTIANVSIIVIMHTQLHNYQYNI